LSFVRVYALYPLTPFPFCLFPPCAFRLRPCIRSFSPFSFLSPPFFRRIPILPKQPCAQGLHLNGTSQSLPPTQGFIVSRGVSLLELSQTCGWCITRLCRAYVWLCFASEKRMSMTRGMTTLGECRVKERHYRFCAERMRLTNAMVSSCEPETSSAVYGGRTMAPSTRMQSPCHSTSGNIFCSLENAR
jgi:hypothetical protein